MRSCAGPRFSSRGSSTPDADDHGFVDMLRAEGYRVEPICAALSASGCRVAPRTYRSWKSAQPSQRTISDAIVVDKLRSTIGTAEGLYGRKKMTAWLCRQGLQVSFCRVDRLMRQEGLHGVRRGKQVRTTIPGRDGERAGDQLNRDFDAVAPNRVWVADFTYVRTWAGFVFVAFVIDCFSRMIVGWHAATCRDASLVSTALKMSLWYRHHTGQHVPAGLVHHSDAGSQYTSIRFGEALTLAKITPSVGSVGDAYDNALAETTIGLYKTEAIRVDSPFRNGPLTDLDDVEWVTLAWIDWYNQRRLHHRLGHIPQVEYETNYYAQLTAVQPEMSLT
jgi:putative transposase